MIVFSQKTYISDIDINTSTITKDISYSKKEWSD